jgi:hypothetical protein
VFDSGAGGVGGVAVAALITSFGGTGSLAATGIAGSDERGF